MSSTCSRCKAEIQPNDNIMGTSFWGLIQKRTQTKNYVRVASTSVRHEDHWVLRSDEELPLCDPCMGLLVGRFLQGREVVALDHDHQWEQMNKFPILERCSLCYQTRITDQSVSEGEK